MWKGYMVDIRYDMRYRKQDHTNSALIDSDGDEQSQPSSIHFPQEQQEPPTPIPRERDRDRRRQVCVICHLSYSCKSSLDLHMRRNHSQSNSRHTGFVPRQYKSQFGDQQEQKPPSSNQPFSYKRENSESASQHPSARQEHPGSQQLSANQERSYRQHSASQQQSASKQGSNSQNYSPIRQPSVTQQSQSENKFKKYICEKCGLGYTGRSSLRGHIKRRHPEWQQGLAPRPRPLTKTKMSCVQCPKCGDLIHSKTALEIHDANKHKGYQPRQPLLNPVIPGTTKPMMDVEEAMKLGVQQCGCGNVYKSRSALNLHIRRKHFGIQPMGTIKHFSSIRPRGTTYQEVKFNNQVEDYLRAQREKSQKEEESIYDSDFEDGPRMEQNTGATPIVRQETITSNAPPPYMPKQVTKAQGPPNFKPPYLDVQPVIQRGRELIKPFKCGCGKAYTVSSSLNLHIKKAHNWVIPLGTIGGPRGLMGGQDEGELIQKNNMYHKGQKAIICSQCGEPQDGTHFECQTCLNHILCSSCFWATNNVNREHTWITRDRS